jgi:SepF-like predicted cell division protein (DUF552 family)
MVLGKIIEKVKQEKSIENPEDEWLEIDESVLKQEQKVPVRIDSLNEYADVERVREAIRAGNIVFLRIRDLRKKDITELKRAVDKLKKTISAVGGDIVGVDEDVLILSPNYAKIWRGQQSSSAFLEKG